MTKKSIEKQIEELQHIAEKLASIAPSPAPVLVNSADHDLLTKLDTKLELLQTTVNKLVDRDENYIARDEWKVHLDSDADHETRIKSLESITTKLWAYGASLVFAVGLVEFLLTKFIK